MWQPKWNGNQTDLAAAICMPGRNAGLLKVIKAGSWSLGIVEQSQGTADWGETELGDVREEIGVVNACGGKPGSHGNKVILLSHT